MKHTCHAVGCAVEVEPRLLMCLRHWRMVPRVCARRIRETYRPGQEVTKNPSAEYLVAQKEAVAAVAAREGKVP
jgi:hypothetical protein